MDLVLFVEGEGGVGYGQSALLWPRGGEGEMAEFEGFGGFGVGKHGTGREMNIEKGWRRFI